MLVSIVISLVNGWHILNVYLADQLAHAFDVLQNDLQTEHGRHLFLHYRALPVILSFIRPANKVLYCV